MERIKTLGRLIVDRLGALMATLLTVIVLLMMLNGRLAWMERELLDLRQSFFAYFNPPPSDAIVHVDIDDYSLRQIGRWPWPRAYLADALNELNHAGADVVMFDVIFEERQEPRWVKTGKSIQTLAGQQQPLFTQIDDDQLLGAAIDDHGKTMLPVLFHVERDQHPTVLKQKVVKVLEQSPAMSIAELGQAIGLSVAQQEAIGDEISQLRTMAINQRLWKMLEAEPELTREQAIARMLPDLTEDQKQGPIVQLARIEYDRVKSGLFLARWIPNEPPDAKRFFEPITLPSVPLRQLTHGAITTGFVTYERDPDGVVRSVPLWLEYEGKRYPHIMLAAALTYWHVPLARVRVTRDATIVPGAVMPAGRKTELKIPMIREAMGEDWFVDAGRIFVSWQTNDPQWQYLFQRGGKEHQPIGMLIEIARQERVLRQQRAVPDTNLLVALKIAADILWLEADQLAPYQQLIDRIQRTPVRKALPAAWRAEREQWREKAVGYIKQAQAELDKAAADQPLPEDVQQLYRHMIAGLQGYQKTQEIQQNQAAKIAARRAEAKKAFDGKICIVGWTATAASRDFVVTSLTGSCPGPVVLGAVLNSILTGHFIERGPLWLDIVSVLLMGPLCGLLASRLSVIWSVIAGLAVLAGYFLVNGLLLYDYLNWWSNAAGPILVGALAWITVITFRVIREQRQRQLIKGQFKNYVSPELVEAIIEDPNVIKRGVNELSVMFLDIAGFTTLTEKLQADVVPVLNFYLGELTNVLMSHGAYVNKYMGDAIMAFWGAPLDNEDHAIDACNAVLDCVAKMQWIEAHPPWPDLPQIGVRFGIATGQMTVDDCGAPPLRSDYTVIGDNVNLGARLESANKQFGTKALMPQRTKELVDDLMLTRPIGRLVVKGKAEYVEVYELLCRRDEATDSLKGMAEMTSYAVQAYYDGYFRACMLRMAELQEAYGHLPLIDVYMDNCRRHLREKTRRETFDGRIVLTSK